MMQQDMSDAAPEKRKRRRRRIVTTVMVWLSALVIPVVVIFGAAVLTRTVGSMNLRKHTQGARPNLAPEDSMPETEAEASQETAVQESESREEVIWQEGWVRHNGKIYEYNENIMTFLVMGIDQMNTVKESTTATGGGQADAIFLVIVNPDQKDIRILGVNRDTMTEIQMYGMGPEGSTVTTQGQLATQHGFGDGKELSCELVKDTVSALFYDIPIHGYLAINMGAIEKLNDAVGGVEVTVLEDLTKASKKLKEGELVTLKGRDAFLYVKWRDTKVFESNRSRLARQKQYLEAFAAKAVEAVKNDITFPVTLYRELSKYMVTDITTDEVTYLAVELLNYRLGEKSIYTLEGETRMGEVHEEFYPDKAAMRELMITLFYKEVEMDE